MKIQKLKLNASDFQIEEDGTISGYASTFNGVDSYGDTILPTSYDKVLNAITTGVKKMPKMFFNHNQFSVPIGIWIELKKTKIGLWCKGKLNLALEQARNVYNAIKFGSVDGLSVCIYLYEEDCEWIEDKQINIIKNVSDLTEISIVTYPADSNARISDIKSAVSEYNSLKDVEKLLRDVGSFSKQAAIAIISAIKRISNQMHELSDSEVEDKSKLDATLICSHINKLFSKK